MVSFYVRPDRLKSTEPNFSRVQNELAQIANAVNSVRNSQVLRGHGAFSQVRRNLQTTYSNTINLKQRTGQLRVAAWNTALAYEQTEQRILGFEVGKSQIVDV